MTYLQEIAYQAAVADWREATKLSNDPMQTPEGRAHYLEVAKELHAEMVELGHRHT